MIDDRTKKLAKILVEHSTKIKKNDRVIIVGDTIAEPLIKEVYTQALRKGAHVHVQVSLPGMTEIYYKNAQNHQLDKFPEVAYYEMKKTDVFIAIRGVTNTRSLSNVDPKKMARRSKASDKVFKERLGKRWVICNYPTNALAMEADMSLTEYEDWFYKACIVDYNAMMKKYQKLKKIIDNGTEARIVGKNTDITLSIKDMIALNIMGDKNVPDGEIFTALEKTKVNGHIEFSYPAIRAGNEVDGIYMEFKNGKVIKATATKNEKFLHSMLNTDPGAKYIGELGIGVNFNITKYTKNLLFDEKIGGTIHLALGCAFPECCEKNKKEMNKSALHWDIVKDLRQGGELYIDGKLIQKNGKFLI